MSEVRSRIEKFKGFLDKNKIFFEVFGWIFVPIALGVMSYVVSCSAIKISRYQAEVAYRQNLPDIRPNVELYSLESNIPNQELLQIYNDGFRLRNFSVKKIVILHVRRQKGIQIDQLSIPINFYPIRVLTNASTGLLVTLTGHKNHEKWVKFDRDLLALGRPGGRPEPVIYLASLLRIPAVRYEDYFGNEHNEYFLVRGFSVNRLPAEQGKEWVQYFEQHRSSFLLDIDSLSVKEIIELFDSAPPALRRAPLLP